MTQVVTKFAGFAVGDVVAVKSGGPDLTIIGFAPADAVGVVPPATPTATFAAPGLVAACFGFSASGAPILNRLPVEALIGKTEANKDAAAAAPKFSAGAPKSSAS